MDIYIYIYIYMGDAKNVEDFGIRLNGLRIVLGG